MFGGWSVLRLGVSFFTFGGWSVLCLGFSFLTFGVGLSYV